MTDVLPAYATAASHALPSPAKPTLSARAPLRLEKPCVIPQTDGRPGARRFVRAYAPQLAAHGITHSDFTLFLHGLNQTLRRTGDARHGVGSLSDVLSYAVHKALDARAGVPTSHLDTAAYLQAFNASTFHPAGLHVRVCSTEEMMNVVFEGVEEPHTLEGTGPRVLPLDLEAPLDPSTSVDAIVAKLGEWYACRGADEQARRLDWDATKQEVRSLMKGLGTSVSPHPSKQDRRAAKLDWLIVKKEIVMGALKYALERKLDEKQKGAEDAAGGRVGELEKEKVARKYEATIAKVEAKMDKKMRKAVDKDREMMLEKERQAGPDGTGKKASTQELWLVVSNLA